MNLAGSLIGVFVLSAAQSPATSAADAADHVVPIHWQRFDVNKPLSSESRTVAKLLNGTLRYNLAWAERTFEVSAEGGYVLKNMGEHGVRPPASVAMALAVGLKTGVYDEKTTGVPELEAKVCAARLIRGVAGTHRANARGRTWGNGWQTALWAAAAGHGAWLMWDDLDEPTRQASARMVEYEADRFLRPGYRVPYWNGEGGDTKAEENAWNAMIHQLAVAMMPRHPHVDGWRRIGSELMVSAFAAKDDWESNTTIVDGKPVKEWLKGYNLRADGAVLNHNLIHCDYMSCVILNLRAWVTQPLAGQAVPQSARFNADRVYRTLVAHHWPSPPYEPPGGTMYIPGKAEVYYPQGTDWSEYRFDIFFELDTFASALGLDKGLPHGGGEWAPLRLRRLVDMQSRHADGRVWAEGEFATYPGAEQEFAWLIADTLLFDWLRDREALGREDNWNQP